MKPIALTKGQIIALNTFLTEYPRSGYSYEVIYNAIVEELPIIVVQEFFEDWNSGTLADWIDDLSKAIDEGFML